MTDKQIIKLKPREDLNEKIIKEKGNTKCIFYSDDICRKGDKTRDCVNCARVEYNSLYSLNWDNQERLQKIIKQKEQECETLASQLDFEVQKKECLEQECEELKKQLTDFMNGEYCANGCAKMQTQYKEYHCKLIEQIDKLKALNKQAEQKLDMIRKYCNYMTTFNNANKTNKGLDVEEVIQIIDEVE